MTKFTQELAFQCCASAAFASLVAKGAPYANCEELITVARQIWWHEVGVAGWLEAFAAHPRIGDVEGLRKKFDSFAEMSKGEQAGAGSASDEILKELADFNKKYEQKFGHIFIICASGKSATEMLAAVNARLGNDPYKELAIAAAEQMKITEIRLAKMVPFSGMSSQSDDRVAASSSAEKAAQRAGQMRAHLGGKPLTSPITSHVLDTSRGCPAEGVCIELERISPGSSAIWESVGRGVTNADGRVPTLMTPSAAVQPGMYRVLFGTSEYMARCRKLHPDFFPEKPFYPSVEVHFEIRPEQTKQHFHIPLTWNPYGYSTYRGS